MNHSSHIATVSNDRAPVLPPRALLYALVAQLPAIALAWPIAPPRASLVAGIVALVAGIALNVVAERLFRAAGVGVCPFTPVARLVDSGPFRLTRHPMYAGVLLIALAPVLLTGMYANSWVPATLAVWLHFRYARPEEDFLRAQFGDA
jgi:protein-S-isoprenylcysteine O-methyltransferase Ste14